MSRISYTCMLVALLASLHDCCAAPTCRKGEGNLPVAKVSGIARRNGCPAMDAESCKDLLGVYFPYGDRYISTTGPVPAFTSNRYANSKLAPLIPFSVARDSDMPQGCVIELFTAENGIKLRGYYNDIETDGAFCSNQYQCICLSGRCATCFAETYSLDGDYHSQCRGCADGKTTFGIFGQTECKDYYNCLPGLGVTGDPRSDRTDGKCESQVASEDEAKITWRYNIERGLAPKTTKFEGKISIKLFFCPEESRKECDNKQTENYAWPWQRIELDLRFPYGLFQIKKIALPKSIDSLGDGKYVFDVLKNSGSYHGIIGGKITWEDMKRGIDTQAYYYNSEKNYNSCSENITCICKIKMCRVCPKGMYSPGGVGQTCISCPKTQQTATPTVGSKYSVRYFDNSSCVTGQKGKVNDKSDNSDPKDPGFNQDALRNTMLITFAVIAGIFVLIFLACFCCSLMQDCLRFPRINAGSLYHTLV